MILSVIILILVTAVILLGIKMIFFLGFYPWDDGPYLVLRKDPASSMTICWITARKKDSTLFWGTDKNNLANTAVHSKSRFHAVTLENLSPDTDYFYRIDEKLPQNRKKKHFQFHTFPEKDTHKPVHFIIAGDLQSRDYPTFKSNRIIAKQIKREKPQFVIQTGDLVQLGTNAYSWHTLMANLPLYASSRPFLAAVGNHEHYIIHSSKNFRTLFPYAFTGEKSSSYSVDIKNMHFTFLDPYDGGFAGMNSRMTTKQKEWVRKDLEKAVQKGAQWIFVVLHQPVFTSGEYANDVRLRNWILPLLFRYNVDAVFFGHSHLYEHWHYQYGQDNTVLASNPLPAKEPIHFFCIGSSGARLESNYKVFSHKPYVLQNRGWINHGTGEKETSPHIQYPWNRNIFFTDTHNSRHYYHFPFTANGTYSPDKEHSYSTVNEKFGYLYGEITHHYAKIVIKDDICSLSIHYPDGTLLTGHDNKHPQEFLLHRKKRKNR